MAISKVSYTFDSVNTGGYDAAGSYYGQSTDAVFFDGFNGESVFYAFQAGPIYNAEAGLSDLTVTLTFNLANADPTTQDINVEAFHLPSVAETQINADSTDSAGADGFTSFADVYNDISNNSVASTKYVQDQKISGSIDVSQAVSGAISAETSPTGPGRSGTGAFTTIPDLFVSFSPDGENGGFTFPSNVSITVSGLLTSGNPTISGTVSNQSVTAGGQLSPFSSVAITDPGNPSGAGDDIQITTLFPDQNGYATASYGTLSGPGLINYGGGVYTLAPTTSVAALQHELDSLVYKANPFSADEHYGLVTFELDLQAGNGGTVDNELTNLVITPQTASVLSPLGPIPCYCDGTLILTAEGELPVETLAIGDVLVTAAGEHRPIRWIGRRSYDGRFIAGDHLMLPVCIRSGALAPGVPHTDLHVSPGHGMYVDGQIVPAWRLVNGVTITQAEWVEDVTYLHVELECHALLLANGAPAESFLEDTGFRNQFANAAEFHARYGDTLPLVPLQARLEDGFALSHIQDRLANRAGLLPSVEPIGALRGFLDRTTPDCVCGWAQDVDSPEEPVALEVQVDGMSVLSVLANAYRADLRRAGIGSGCHAFDAVLPHGLSGVVTVCRAADRTVLHMTEAAATLERRQAA